MVRVYITLFALLNHGPFKLSEHIEKWFEPNLTPAERTVGGVEGWILGIP